MMVLSVSTSVWAQVPFSKQATYNKMRQVADWQIADFNTNQRHDDVNWANAALYIGMADWAQLSDKVDQHIDCFHQPVMDAGIGKQLSPPARQRRKYQIESCDLQHRKRYVVRRLEREFPVEREVPEYRQYERRQVTRHVRQMEDFVQQGE